MSRADEEEPLLPAAQEAELLGALEVALRPHQLDPVLHERLIDHALQDPLAAATQDELRESARLRDALEHATHHEDLATLAALRVAFDAPAPESPALERALDAALQGRPAPRSRSNLVYALFGAGSVVIAAAAAIALFISPSPSEPPSLAGELMRPRSTAALFSDRFETGDTTARVDLIVSARQRDLRDNRYASWGVP